MTKTVKKTEGCAVFCDTINSELTVIIKNLKKVANTIHEQLLFESIFPEYSKALVNKVILSKLYFNLNYFHF